MTKYKLRVDFQNTDELGRLRLIVKGALDDIKEQNIDLIPGLTVMVYQEDLLALATVEYSEDEKIWVAKIKEVYT